ncbi:MAG: hypothetical protein A2144_00835 [Chloroflexi bacterium RBG_16_50_9]|nr:MAG: hypothetical protein A2144_00835 [Chloroflexi bacterium RBG_16_50_9]
MDTTQDKSAKLLEPESPKYRNLSGPLKWLYGTFIWALVVVAVYHVFGFRFFGRVMFELAFVALLLFLLLPMVFIVFPASKKARRDKVPWYDYCLAGLSIPGPLFVFFFAERMYYTIWSIEPPLVVLIMGLVLWGLILEGTRRTMGWILALVIGFFSIYPLFASHLPMILFAKSYSIQRLTGFYFLGSEGVFGTAMQMFGRILLGFMIFGMCLKATGASKVLLDLSMGLVGRFRGAPALVAVVASSLMASLSGSAVANVIGTGTTTIPAMKKMGYKPHAAAAIEAVASTGGTMMPPVMGASAFLMAGLLNISYASVAIGAAIPMVLYYTGLFSQVLFRASAHQLPVLPASEIPSIKQTLKKSWFYLGAIIVLMYFLFWVRVETWAAYYATAFLFACAMIRKETRPNLTTLRELTFSIGHTLTELAPVLVGVGFILGSLSLTGVGQSIGGELVLLAHGNLFVLLILGAIGAFFLGMGMPMLLVFIFMYVTFVPSLVEMGVPDIAANLFFMYWAMIAFITPPVCIAVYAAASIAQADPMKTGRQAVRFGIVAYVIPFAFVLYPALTAEGSIMSIILATFTAIIGAVLIGGGVEGYMIRVGKLNMIERVLLGCSGILLIAGIWIADLIGVAIAVIILIVSFGRTHTAQRGGVTLTSL